MRLTAAAAGGLKLDTDVTDKIFFDTDVPGFGVRVRASGARTWIFQYKIGGRTRRLVLGQCLRNEACQGPRDCRRAACQGPPGRRPGAEKRERVQRSQDTFGTGGALPRAVQARPRTKDEVVRHLQKYAAPLHPMPIDSITLRDVADLLAKLDKSSGRRPRTVSAPRYPPSSAGRCARGWRSPILS